MRLEYQILAAYGMDLLLGDPRWLPHPVKGIAWFALALESLLRRLIPNARAAGVLAVLAVLAVAGGSVWGLIALAGRVHPALADGVSIVLLYTCFAGRDLARHSGRVYQALAADDLPEARRRVAMLVGRDTEHLDEPEVVRATVESVAENLVDGVTAPVFFAVLGGPAGAMVYKAVNTLDSTFGYKNERYLQFGWAAARLDDLANFIPARLTVPFMLMAAWVLRLKPLQAWRICRRDGRKHPSPNSGLAEATVAGALGVQLGGINSYFGVPSERPRMGDAQRPLGRNDVPRVNRLMGVAAGLTLCVLLVIRFLLVKS
ncbi:MAG: adenosylcobinamide-phosphate synthase CbiB [Verrucomicrobiales bacterium]|nr:adenosylcobinamide-phosphate synthase CbiB [Verrucomicrobiota bacterium JB025]